MTQTPPPPPPDAPEPPGGTPPPYAATPPPWGAPAATASGESASWGARLGAYIIDGIIQQLFFIPAYIAFVAGPKETKFCEVDSSGDLVFGGNNVNAICEGPTGATIGIAVLLGLVGFVGILMYRAKTEGATGQTVGKKAVGIRTVDATTGGPIGAGRAIGRYFAYIVSGVVCYLGFLWPLWDKDQQAWHDKILTTRVVKA